MKLKLGETTIIVAKGDPQVEKFKKRTSKARQELKELEGQRGTHATVTRKKLKEQLKKIAESRKRYARKKKRS